MVSPLSPTLPTARMDRSGPCEAKCTWLRRTRCTCAGRRGARRGQADRAVRLTTRGLSGCRPRVRVPRPRHSPPGGGAPPGSPPGLAQSSAGASPRRLDASSSRRLPSAMAASTRRGRSQRARLCGTPRRAPPSQQSPRVAGIRPQTRPIRAWI